jgi:hypothetical protein
MLCEVMTRTKPLSPPSAFGASPSLSLRAACRHPANAFALLIVLSAPWRDRGASPRGGLTKTASAALTRSHPTAISEFKNAYSLEFLGLPIVHSERGLHRAIVHNLGRFITELGRDFCFV